MRNFVFIHKILFVFLSLGIILRNARNTILIFLEYRIIDYSYVQNNVLLFGASVFLLVVYTFFYRRISKDAISQKDYQKFSTFKRMGFILCLGAALFLFYAPQTFLSGSDFRVWIWGAFSVLGVILLYKPASKIYPLSISLFVLLIFPLLIFLINQCFHITTYPFSLYWSETGHFAYGHSYYSFLKGDGHTLFPYMNHSRYLLLSIPWFFDSSNIIFHRIWETWLNILAVGLVAFLLIKEVSFSKSVVAVLGIWAALFILQGPIYYHLLLAPILLLAGKKKSGISVWLVFFVSIWAGFSRINWLPVPAAVAILLMLLEMDPQLTPRNTSRGFLWKIAGYARAGLSGGIIGYVLTFLTTNTPPEILTSAFSSQIIWTRLLPNPTYGPGIIFGALLAAGPGMILLFRQLRSRRVIFSTRVIGSTAILLIFLAGGAVVSLKIGGGADLHNLDGFLLLLLIILIHNLNTLKGGFLDIWSTRKLSAVSFVLFCLPAFMLINSSSSIPQRDYQNAEMIIQNMQELIDSNEKILLGAEQHLILFGELSGVDYYPALEKTLVMEAAMSNNQAFYDNYLSSIIESKDFNYLIFDGQPIKNKDSKTSPFAEENNVLKKFLADNLKKFNEEIELSLSEKFDIYIPKK